MNNNSASYINARYIERIDRCFTKHSINGFIVTEGQPHLIKKSYNLGQIAFVKSGLEYYL